MGYKIVSENPNLGLDETDIHIREDGSIQMYRGTGRLFNNSGDSKYDNATYSFDADGKLDIQFQEAKPRGFEELLGIIGGGSSNYSGSYGEFLKMYGDENNRAYSESIRQTNNDYARALMTYGKNAEMLAGNGLSSSGVSDYGNHAAYAARQGAVTAAQDRLTQENKADMAEYQNYLAQLRAEAQQTKNARVNLLLQAMQSGVTDENTATAIAASSGLFNSEEEYAAFAEAIKNYGQSVNTTTTTDNSQTLFANTQAAFDNLIASGYSPEQAKSQLAYWAEQMPSQYDINVIEGIYNKHNEIKGMMPPAAPGGVDIPEEEFETIKAKFNSYAENLDAETAAELINKEYSNYTDADGKGIGTIILGDYNKMTDTVLGVQLENMLSETNYSPLGENKYTVSSIRAMINASEISEAEGEEQIKEIQAKNGEYLSNLIDAAHDNGGKRNNLQKACQELEITYDGSNKEGIAAEVVKALRERAEQLYYADELSEKEYANILQKDFQYEVEGALDDKFALRNICGSIVDFSNYTDEMQNGEFEYSRMIERAVQDGTISFDIANNYNHTGRILKVSVNGNNGIETTNFDCDISGYKQISEGEIIGRTAPESEKGFLEDSFAVLKSGEIGFIDEQNGKLFMYVLDFRYKGDYSADQLNVVKQLIGNIIVNQK